MPEFTVGAPRRFMRLIFPLLIISGACERDPLAPELETVVESPTKQAARKPPLIEDINKCFTSVAASRNGSPWYRYNYIELDLPPGLRVTAQTQIGRFRYIRWDNNGNVARVANCIIPVSPQAIKFAVRRFSHPRFDGGPPTHWSQTAITDLRTTSAVNLDEGSQCYYDWIEEMWRCSDSCWYRWEEGGVANSAELTTTAADGDWVIDHCEADPIATCGTGKTWDEFTESCVCDNGSREEDCWLPPEEPGCDDVFEECGGDDGGDTGGGSGPCTTCQPDEPPGYPPDGVPIDEYERLNREERRLCWANAAECSGVNSARHMAEEFSEARAAQDGFSGILVDNKYDAMRHAYWNAVMTRAMGEDRADVWATAHEWGGSPNNPARCMDLANNAIGRSVGAASTGQTYPYMQTVIANMANANPPQLVVTPAC